jgi:hypothetical protein
VITSAKASAYSKLLKLKGNTYSTKQARHLLSAGMIELERRESFSIASWYGAKREEIHIAWE